MKPFPRWAGFLAGVGIILPYMFVAYDEQGVRGIIVGLWGLVMGAIVINSLPLTTEEKTK